ncbi:hypothetical protein TWF730_007347 [Orbilia blumenaviensis]|uniref:Uncharacterized protein n=1 Tax=Orbilia blumenaviensis TaxID=1796055 RepID=A0AAV9VAF6_9PEZI
MVKSSAKKKKDQSGAKDTSRKPENESKTVADDEFGVPLTPQKPRKRHATKLKMKATDPEESTIDREELEPPNSEEAIEGTPNKRQKQKPKTTHAHIQEESEPITTNSRNTDSPDPVQLQPSSAQTNGSVSTIFRSRDTDSLNPISLQFPPLQMNDSSASERKGFIERIRNIPSDAVRTLGIVTTQEHETLMQEQREQLEGACHTKLDQERGEFGDVIQQLKRELERANERSDRLQKEVEKFKNERDEARGSSRYRTQDLEAEGISDGRSIAEKKYRDLIRGLKSDIRDLERQSQLLETDLEAEKEKNEELQVRQRETDAQLEEYHSTVRRLQQSEFNATKKGPVLLDEDVKQKIESIFGLRLRTWSRHSTRGSNINTVLSNLRVIQEEPCVCQFLSFDAIVAPFPQTLKCIGLPSFLEALVSSTIATRFFSCPFFLCPPEIRVGLMEVRSAFEATDLPATCEWTSRTATLLESSSGVGVDCCQREFAETLNGYMQMFMEDNGNFQTQNVKSNEAKLSGIVHDCAKVSLEWHKHESKIGLIDRYLFEKTDGRILWEAKYEEWCVPHKGTIEDLEEEAEDLEIVAFIRPGFCKYTGPDGKPLDKLLVLTKAVVALQKVVDEDTIMKDLQPSDIEGVSDRALKIEETRLISVAAPQNPTLHPDMNATEVYPMGAIAETGQYLLETAGRIGSYSPTEVMDSSGRLV